MRRASPAEMPCGASSSATSAGVRSCRTRFIEPFEVAQEVFAEQLLEALLAEPALPQELRDARQIAHVAHPARQRHEAVEVGAERDRVLAGDLDDVLDVIADGLDGGAEQSAEEVGGEDDADDAALLAHGAQLLVVEVTRMRLQRLAA